MSRKFEFSEEQMEKFNKWRDKLPKKYKANMIEYVFMPTGIGEVVLARVIDNNHKVIKEINLTEYEKW